jgi:hypothetical protein
MLMVIRHASYEFTYLDNVVKTHSDANKEQYKLYTEANGIELLSVLNSDVYELPDVISSSPVHVNFEPEELASAKEKIIHE